MCLDLKIPPATR
jgi:hypothetical protein